MTKKKYKHITIVSFIIGFMLAVQYNTVQSPDEHESRNVWEVRQNLSDEKQHYSELLGSIRDAKAIVEKYEDEEFNNPELILAQTVQDLRKQAGLLPVEGPGLILKIEPAPELVQFGYNIEMVSPDLLTRLINELYRFSAQHVQVANQRVSYSTPIRDLNGKTSVNSIPLNDPTFEIKVVTDTVEHAEKLYNYLLASSFRDEFYIDNLSLTIQEVDEQLSIDATVDMPNYSILKEKEE